MRLIHLFSQLEEAQVFSLYLTYKKIENKIEVDKRQQPSYQVWGIQEEQLDKANVYLQEFLKNPQDEKFNKIRKTASTFNQAFKEIIQKVQHKERRFSFKRFAPVQWITPTLLATCLALSIFLNFPQLFEIDFQALLSYDNAPQAIPYPGFFHYLLLLLKGHSTPFFYWLQHFSAFGSLQQGEVWRLFTPALMHYDPIHFIFNMLWLSTLGPQIEARLSSFRYLLFILVAAGFSNTCQYLMTGSSFLGFSGVVLAMLGFIWMRQKTALWEGYTIHSSTYTFIAIYTLGLLAIEMISLGYYLIYGQLLFGNIANTAHISGWVIGMLLGRLSFFSMKD